MIDLNSYNTNTSAPGSFFRRASWYIISLIFFETRIPWPYALKRTLLSLFGCQLRDGLIIKPKVKIKYPWFLSVGSNCWIGEEVWIDNLCAVTLGDEVVLSQGAYLLTGNHDSKKRSFDLMLDPLEIKSGAWIAAKSIVCPGVSIGEYAVLIMGSVASKSLDKHSVYSGNPATFKRKRDLSDEPSD